MKCPECGNEGYQSDKDKFEILKVENSDSNWDDWDQDITLKCKECGKIFHNIW